MRRAKITLMRLFVGAGLGAAGAGLALVGGCDEDGIVEHRVEKGVESVPSGDPAGEASARGGAGVGAVDDVADEASWTVPAGWSSVPGERSMRLATFEAEDESGPVEVAVTRFAGRVGGELANINRWRGQMGLGPIAEGELEETIERFGGPGFEGYQAWIAGEAMHMLAAGVYERAEDRTWFVRATLEPEAAERLADEVFGFARSIGGGPNEPPGGGER